MSEFGEEYFGGAELVETDILFPVSVLNIQLDTNVDGVKTFKRSMLKTPKTSRVPALTSEYPFFTKYVKYPSWIEYEPWQTRFEFFFNRDMFIDRLRKAVKKNDKIWIPKSVKSPEKKDSKSGEAEVDPAKAKEDEENRLQEFEIHNIMVTLRSIFPIPEVFGNALQNSYRHILNNNSNFRIVSDVNVKNAVNIFGFMYKFGIADRAKEEYFINISGKRYSIERVVWENDVVNHPEYFKFLSAHHETFEEVEKSKDAVQSKYNGYLEDLNKQLDEMAAVDELKIKFYDIVKSSSSAPAPPKLFDINFKEKDVEISDASKYVAISKFIKSKQEQELVKLLKEFLFEGRDLNKTYEPGGAGTGTATKNSLIQLFYKNSTKSLGEIPYDGAIFTQFNTLWPDKSKVGEDAILEFVKKIKIENTQFSIWLNLINNMPTDERSRDRAQVNERMQEKFKRLYGDGRESGNDAAKTILGIKEDADAHEESKREPITVFFTGEYNKFFVDLLKFAVQVNAAEVVYKFAEEGVPMILTDKQLDGSEERPIIKRRNKFIRDNFGTEAGISNKLANSVNNVYEPVRKTSNVKLYKLIRQLKSDLPISPYLTADELKQIEKERQIFQQIYAKYISTYASSVNQEDIKPYLYTGVEEAKISTDKEDGKEAKIARNVQEIYVRVNLVEALKMETTSKAPCKYYDKLLENEYLYLTDKRNKNTSRLPKYRDFVFDAPNPLSELAIVAAEEAKNSLEETNEKRNAAKEKADKQQSEPGKKTERREGGDNKRYSRKNRPFGFRNKTLSAHHQ